MLKRLVLIGSLALVASSGFAQDTIRLQFELVKNDTVIAKPQLSVAEGGQGSLAVPEFADISFSAGRPSEGRVPVSFEIQSAGQTTRPRVVLVQSEPVSVTWKHGSDSLLLRVAVLQ